MSLYEKIYAALEDMNTLEIVKVHNEYCEKRNYFEDRIYYMEEFDLLFNGRPPLEILGAVSSDFNISDDYFYETIFGLESFTYWNENNPIYLEDIASYIAENNEALENRKIARILESEN